MLKLLWRFILSAVIFFHCIGVTQLLSAYAKDSSTFISMLSMSEEETKKEKECKEDVLQDDAVKHQMPVFVPVLNDEVAGIVTTKTQDNILHQYWAERPTPPPDSRA